MKILFAILLIFSHSFALAFGRDTDRVETSIKGKKLTEFIKKYTQTEIDRIAGGRCISITVPNSEKSDRIFYSVQLFLVKSLDGKLGSVDVFETTSGHKREDINLLPELDSAVCVMGSDGILPAVFGILPNTLGTASESALESLKSQRCFR